MANILLAGCGDLGTALALELIQAGHVCFGLRRQCNQLPDAIQAISADVTQAQTLDNLPAALDYVVYSLTPAGFNEAGYQAAYVDGLANLLSALRQQNQRPKRIFYLASTAVYHQNQGQWVDETSDTQPSGFSGQAMLAAEKLLWDCSFPATSVRLSGIYGPGRERLLNWAKEGMTSPVTPPHYSNRIHRDDCIGVLKHLIELDLSGAKLESIYLASDPNPSNFADILNWLREQLGVPSSNDGELISKRLRTGSKRCNPDRLLQSGYQFKYPDFRAGFKALVKPSGK